MEINQKYIDRIAARAMCALIARGTAPKPAASLAFSYAEAMWEERYQRYKPKPGYEFTKPKK